MINAIRIRGFQNIYRADLELESLTFIVGDSNTGKSAVIRALDSIPNCPRGRHLVTEGFRRATVEIVSNGKVIKWIRNMDSSPAFSYSLDDQKYEGVTTVPIPILSAFPLKPLELANGETVDIQIGLQFDPPFLVGDSTTTAARVIASLSGADTLAEAGNLAGVKATEATRQLNRISRDVRDLQQSIAELDWVDVAQQLHKSADEFHAEIQTKAERAHKFGQLIKAYNLTQEYITEVQRITALEDGADLAASYVSNIEAGSQRLKDMKTALETYTSISESMEPLSNLASVRVPEKLKGAMTRMKRIDELVDQYESTVQDHSRTVNTLNGLMARYRKIQEEEREMREAIEFCPTCGARL